MEVLEALAALAGTLGADINREHPLNSLLKCNKVDAKADGFGKWIAYADYAIPENGEFPDNTDPLNAKPRILWRTGIWEDESDVDVSGNHVTNTARDTYNQTPRKRYKSRFLTIIRNEPFYDVGKAEAFENTVNTASVTFEGYTFQAGWIMCLTIQPVGEYVSDATYVTIAYEFEIRIPVPTQTTLAKANPFQWRLLDQGSRARYSGSSANAPLHHSPSRAAMTRDVRLNGDGVPMSSDYKVTEQLFTPTSQGLPTGAQKDDENSSAVYLIWTRYEKKAFSGLGL